MWQRLGKLIYKQGIAKNSIEFLKNCNRRVFHNTAKGAKNTRRIKFIGASAAASALIGFG